MKKTILLIFTLLLLSCGSDDNKETPIQDQVVGKWMLYRTTYQSEGTDTVYEYEINGDCGKESLILSAKNNQVTDTYFTNDDCTTYSSSTLRYWTKLADGSYGIFESGMLVPERTVIMVNDEIEVTAPDIITVVKNYRRAM